MHGLGNSQILVEDLEENIEEKVRLSYGEIARALCHPGFGIGGDQTLIILPSTEADYQMRVFNKDGGEAEMCGNGIRCVARYLFDRDMIDEKPHIETEAGIKELKITERDGKPWVEVMMGEGKIIDLEKEVQGFTGSYVSVGNPHFVIFTKEASRDMAVSEGPGLENAEAFLPEKANIEFAKKMSGDEIETYVWERGAGLTLACGTGACATAFVAKKKKFIESSAKIKLPGGTLKIELMNENKILMKGPAEYVMDGKVEKPKKIFNNIKMLG